MMLKEKPNITPVISVNCRFEVVPLEYSFWYKGKSYYKVEQQNIGGFGMGWALNPDNKRKLFTNDTWVEGLCEWGR